MEVVAAIAGYLALPVKFMLGAAFMLPYLKRRTHFALRAVATVVVILAVCASVGGHFTGALLDFAYNGGVYVLLVAGMFVCFRGHPISLLFCSSVILSVQQITFDLLTMLYLWVWDPLVTPPWFNFVWNIVHVIAAVIAYLLGRYVYLPRISFEEEKIRARKEVVIIFLVLFGVIFVCKQLMLSLQVANVKVYPFVYLIEAVACFFALGYLFGIFNRNKLDEEVAVMTRLMSERERMYESSRENIDIINRKCHDLKYMLRAFADRQNSEELREIGEAVNIYGAAPKTGSAALDVILAESHLRCRDADIDLTCSADGGLLSFMRDTDVYALFGNIMSNAVEAASAADEKGRYIRLFVGRAGSGELLRITEENGYAGDVAMDGGRPVTTKEDKNVHGFGTRSIEFISEKYGGGVHFEASEGRFRLSVVLPLPEARDRT